MQWIDWFTQISSALYETTGEISSTFSRSWKYLGTLHFDSTRSLQNFTMEFLRLQFLLGCHFLEFECPIDVLLGLGVPNMVLHSVLLHYVSKLTPKFGCKLTSALNFVNECHMWHPLIEFKVHAYLIAWFFHVLQLLHNFSTQTELVLP